MEASIKAVHLNRDCKIRDVVLVTMCEKKDSSKDAVKETLETFWEEIQTASSSQAVFERITQDKVSVDFYVLK